jgi:hypothetical protein
MKKKHKRMLAIGAAFAFAAAGTYLLLNKGKKSKEDKPPKKAPQLPIENPGDQSEFITATSPSEMG